MWNNWKGKLLEDLYHATRAVLAGAAPTRTMMDSIDARRAEAQRLLRLYAVPEGAEAQLWQHLDTPYFQRHTAEEIAWHARHLYWRVERTDAGRQGAAVARRRRHAGARLPARPEGAVRAPVRILRPRGPVDPTRRRSTRRAHGYALDTFALNDPAQRGGVVPRDAVDGRVRAHARARRAARRSAPPAEGRISRRVKHFPLTPEVQIFPDDKGTHYILEVVAGDRPGLLARIAYTLAKANINVASAKINTLGDRAEDVFLIDGARLHDEQALLRLETALYEELRT